MSDVRDELASSQAREAHARKRWIDAIEECTAFEAAAVAARYLDNTLRSKRGKKTKKQQDETTEAKASHDMVAAAFKDSEAQVKSAEQALSTVKASTAQVQRRYDLHMATEKKRVEAAKRRAAEAEAYRKREEARQRRAESEQKRSEQQRPKAEKANGKGARDDRKPHSEENNSKRKHEEEPRRPEAPRVPKMPKVAVARTITAKEKQDWFEACTAAFADKSEMRTFPEPPVQPCRDAGCAAEKHARALKACKCNIREMFKSRTTLKLDRIKFHPDRFSSCADNVRTLMQQKAKEVFVVVNAMFQGR
ncbi:hypothetical protein LTR36_000610 [Oleoguttula mirabilis]|uniref:Uncharacterized protein n=1 Tax=Oleoguttula mirabilis TaxID=1507867 RepID=A0AAV9JQC7_9PEZI|nr:hypothetical protein LTR36_000610 [Oleoguttula mirabilis]